MTRRKLRVNRVLGRSLQRSLALMPSFIDEDGNLVQGTKPRPKGVIKNVAVFLWSILNFLWVFLSSIFATKSAKDKTSASGGVVNKGGKWGSGAAGTAGGAAAGKPGGKPRSNIMGVGDFKPDPCASGG